MKSVLVVDIGNTTSVVAVVSCPEGIAARGRAGQAAAARVARSLRTVSRVVVPTGATGQAAALRAVREAVGRRRPEGAVISSVVPAVNSRWRKAVRAVLKRDALMLTHRLELGVKINYPQPASIGADRLANACAARMKYGAPVIVADFGTALTFDIISAKSEYIGGVIVPGLPFMTDYMAEKTALLPRIRLRRPRHIVGRSTVAAMQIGAEVGYRGAVREIFGALRAELGARTVLCATGGHAGWVLKRLNMKVELDPYLTLHGLAIVYELNGSV